MSEIKRIVLTGGPGSGKTTALEYVRNENPDVYCEKEALTSMIWGELQLEPGTEPDEEYLKNEGLTLRYIQRQIDSKAKLEAKQRNSSLIVQDGCTLNIATKFETDDEFAEICDVNIAKEIGKYSIVLFMRTYAGTTNYKPNPDAQYTEEEAVVTNNRLRELWRPHPKVLEITGASVETRAKVVSHLINLIKNDRL